MLIERRSNKWHVEATLGNQEITKVFNIKLQAYNYAKLIREAHEGGKRIPKTLPKRKRLRARTMGELLELTIKHVWKGSSAAYSQTLNARQMVEFLGEKTLIKNVEAEDIYEIMDHLDEIGNKAGTINRKVSAISRMLTFAVDCRIIKGRFRIERRKESKGRLRFFTYKEEESIVQTFKDMGRESMGDFTRILCETGLRRLAAKNILWSDFTHNNTQIVYTRKGGKIDQIPLTKLAQEIFNKRREMGFLQPFCDFNIEVFREQWCLMKKSLGFGGDREFTPHTCRHTFCSRLVQAGVPLVQVKELAGHEAFATTLRYAHLRPSDLIKSIETLSNFRLENEERVPRLTLVKNYIDDNYSKGDQFKRHGAENL